MGTKKRDPEQSAEFTTLTRKEKVLVSPLPDWVETVISFVLQRCPQKWQLWARVVIALAIAIAVYFGSLKGLSLLLGPSVLNWARAIWISIPVLGLLLHVFLEGYPDPRDWSMYALGLFAWLAVALLLMWEPLTGKALRGIPPDEGGTFQPPPAGIRNGNFGNGFAAWNTSQEGGLPEPQLDYEHYRGEEPSVVLGQIALGDTLAEEIVPVGCSILSQEIHVPDEPAVALAFDWSMVTYDVLCDEEERTMDSLDILVEEGANSTLIFREGNPCTGTSQHKHWMDWCSEAERSADNWRHDVISLATWRDKDIKLTFMLCNRDAPDTRPYYDYYNSWVLIDNVEILREGQPTQRCWTETICNYGKCTPRMH